MAKGLYLRVKYFKEHPQQFGGAMDNIAAELLVGMWKSFLFINKQYRKVEYDKYYKTDMKLLELVKGKLFDEIELEFANNRVIMSGDDMVKKREGVGLREKRVPKAIQHPNYHLDYLCSFE